MDAIPTIDREALIADLRHRLPDATVKWSWVNRSYGSWTINIRRGHHRVEIAWGPLSGFGATDQNNLRDDVGLFAAFDWPLNSADEAVAFAARILRGTVGRPADHTGHRRRPGPRQG